VGLGVGLGLGVGVGLGLGTGVGTGVGDVLVPPDVDVDGVVLTKEEDFIPAPPPHPTTPKIDSKTATNLLFALRNPRKMSLQVGISDPVSG